MKKYTYILVAVALFASCREKYEAVLKEQDLSILVVEGLLQAGGPTTIKLSKVLKTTDKANFKPELRAVVSVEGKDNSKYLLAESGNGNYAIGQLNIQTGREYRLTIRTFDGRQYASDFVMAKKTPAIDSLQWVRDEGVSIYLHTHDANNSSRYYKWDYDETWEIQSDFDARYKWNPVTGTITATPQGAGTFRCWKHNSSKEILVGSTAALQNDVVYQQPVMKIPYKSEKIGVRYSIIVRQNTISKEAYNYFLLMKKNTELQGSIFDPMPSELRGNIYRVNDPNEQVVGYIDASTLEQKRIFISYLDVQWRYTMSCEQFKVPPIASEISKWVPKYLPFEFDMGAYIFAPAECVDCTVRGGSTIKPVFW